MLFQKPVSGLVLLCCLVSISPLLKAQSYRILITNDDGIESTAGRFSKGISD